MWETIKTIITHRIQTTFGERKKTRRKNWFDDNCEGVLKLRSQARQRMLQDSNVQNTQKCTEPQNKARKTI